MAKKEEIWCNTKGIDFSVSSTENKFYIGDPCYALKDELYEGVWGAKDYRSGNIKDRKGNTVLLVDNTAYGDGLYPGGFAVDAGALAVVPWEYCNPDSTDLRWGRVISVKPGTKMRLVTYGKYTNSPGKFVWKYTDPEGKRRQITTTTF